MAQTFPSDGSNHELSDLKEWSGSGSGSGSGSKVISGQETYRDDTDTDLCFENILDKLGRFGKFQLIQCLLCMSPLLRACFMSMGFTFTGYAPPHSCREVNETQLLLTSQSDLLQNASSLTAVNFDVTYGQCDIKVSSNQTSDGVWTKVTTLECPNDRYFPQGHQTTMVSEWDLVCEKTGLVETTSLAFNLGTLIGGFLVPPIADRYGRKPVLCASVILSMCLEFATAFAPNMYVVLAFLFINGIVTSGLNCTYTTLGMEILIARHRQLFAIAIDFSWVACCLVVGFAAYLLDGVGWRYFQAVGALTGLVCVALPILLHESPRWLMINGKPRKALFVLKKASEQNGANFEEVKLAFDRYMNSLFPSEERKQMLVEGYINKEKYTNDENGMTAFDNATSASEKESQGMNVEKYTLFSMFKSKDSCILLFTIWYMWTMANLVEFGIYFSSSYLAGNRFLNFCLMAVVEIPAYFAIMFMLDKMGRLAALRISLLLLTISLLTSVLLSQFTDHSVDSDIATTVLFFIGKFAISSAYTVIYVITPELFPTVLRSTGSGSCRSVPKIGAMLAPYSRPLYAVAKWAPGTIFASMSFVGLLLTTLLPETKNRNLPTTLEDMGKGKLEGVKRVDDE